MAYYKALIAAAALLMGCPSRDPQQPVDMREYYQKQKSIEELDRIQNGLRMDEIRRKGHSSIPEKPR